MIAVVQRVSSASVRVGEDYEASIGRGLLILLGVAQEDTDDSNSQTIDQMVVTEGDESARLAMAGILGDRLEAYPEGRATLQRLLESDSSQRVRKLAATTLYADR